MAEWSRRDWWEKRKDISGRELNQSQSTKMKEGGNDLDFTKDLLQALRNENVHVDFKSILTDTLQERIQELKKINQANNDHICAGSRSAGSSRKTRNRWRSPGLATVHTKERSSNLRSKLGWAAATLAWSATDVLVLGLAAILGVSLLGNRALTQRGQTTTCWHTAPCIAKFISYSVPHRVYKAQKLIKGKPFLKKVYFLAGTSPEKTGCLCTRHE